jgi:hypothetical protein
LRAEDEGTEAGSENLVWSLQASTDFYDNPEHFQKSGMDIVVSVLQLPIERLMHSMEIASHIEVLDSRSVCSLRLAEYKL